MRSFCCWQNTLAAREVGQDSVAVRDQWIPYAAVVPHLGQPIDRKKKHMIDAAYLPAGSETQWFWPIWLGNMQKAAKSGSLPWQQQP